MKKIFAYVVLMACTTVYTNLSAHALWIEADPVGKENVPHEVRIFYGEYADKEIEPVDKWYSDVREFELWLLAPDQERVKLPLKKESDHFTASFTPIKKGTYVLSVVHVARDLGGKTKYEFSSVAQVAVGASVSNTSLPFPLAIAAAPKPNKKGDLISVTVSTDGKPLPDTNVLVMGPDGWSKSFKSDRLGVVTFPALWKGNYVLEASKYAAKEGEWNGEKHTHFWQGSTTFLKVK